MNSLKQESQMPLPRLLVELISSGRWKQPSDAAIQAAVPFLREPIDFLMSEARMRSESSGQVVGLDHMREYRGSLSTPRALPWLDAELSLFIAVNREIGADLGIALDYRENREDPRVVVSDWWTGDDTLHWREAFPTFTAFVLALNL